MSSVCFFQFILFSWCHGVKWNFPRNVAYHILIGLPYSLKISPVPRPGFPSLQVLDVGVTVVGYLNVQCDECIHHCEALMRSVIISLFYMSHQFFMSHNTGTSLHLLRMIRIFTFSDVILSSGTLSVYIWTRVSIFKVGPHSCWHRLWSQWSDSSNSTVYPRNCFQQPYSDLARSCTSILNCELNIINFCVYATLWLVQDGWKFLVTVGTFNLSTLLHT